VYGPHRRCIRASLRRVSPLIIASAQVQHFGVARRGPVKRRIDPFEQRLLVAAVIAVVLLVWASPEPHAARPRHNPATA
jgi:hypothetical protein